MDFPFRHTPSTFVDVARIVDHFEALIGPAIVNNRTDKKANLASVLVIFTKSLLDLFPNDLVATDYVSLGAPPNPNLHEQPRRSTPCQTKPNSNPNCPTRPPLLSEKSAHGADESPQTPNHPFKNSHATSPKF